MKKYLTGIALTASLIFVSCDKSDEPTASFHFNPVFIHSDDYTESFDYNNDGEIKEWNYLDSKTSTPVAKANYEFPNTENLIKISSMELRGDQKWEFDEHLFLNSDGTAKSAEGTVSIFYRSGEGMNLLMKKRYTVNFEYNASRQLELIQIAEKRFDDYSEESQALKWNAALKWEGNNLIEYKEYANQSYPMILKEYSYYDGVEVDYAPIVQYPVLRSFYSPLLYRGVFGKLSKGLVKTTILDNNYRTEYTYNVSTTTQYSIVEEYSRISPAGEETKHVVGWEKTTH